MLSKTSESQLIIKEQINYQRTDLQDTDKSRYFARTEFNNCFIIIHLQNFVLCFLRGFFSRKQDNLSLKSSAKRPPLHVYKNAHVQSVICS